MIIYELLVALGAFAAGALAAPPFRGWWRHHHPLHGVAPHPGRAAGPASAADATAEIGNACLAGLEQAGIVGLVCRDGAGRILDANDAFLDMLGRTRDELDVGDLSWRALTPPEWERVDARAEHALARQGACATYEKEFRHAAGHRVPVLVGAARVTPGHEESVAFVVDLTAIKARHARAQASEERLRFGLSSAGMGLWEWDEHGNALVTSETLRQLFRIPEDAVSAADLRARIHPEDRHRVAHTMAEALRQDQECQLEYRVVLPDGSTRWMASVARPLRGDNGERRLIGRVEDITARKQVEIERDALLERERAARAEAERANRLKDEFLSLVSHELRTPLNAIMGWAHVLEGQLAGQDAPQQAVAVIRRNAVAQARVIEDLLDLGTILAQGATLNVARLDLREIVDAAVENHRQAAESRRVVLAAAAPGDPLPVDGDRRRLLQATSNLIANAVKFTPAGGTVDVRAERTPTHAVIRVSDTGEGIDEAFLPFVFDDFRQADSSRTRRHAGLGVGLTLVKRIVEAHGGDVEVSSEGRGAGATFVLRVPLADNARHEPPSSPSASLDRRSVEHDLAGLRVLVVDDDADTCEFVRRVLSDAQAEVNGVHSVAEALAEWDRVRPDVLVSDIGMPEQDGYTLVRTVRSFSAERGGLLPAVALTAFTGSQVQREAMQAGFDALEPKPVRPERLVEVIASAVSRRR